MGEPAITFRRLVEEDLPVLHGWLNDPAVVEWWEGDDVSWSAVQRDYSPNPDPATHDGTEHWIFAVDGVDAGWIQCWPATEDNEESAPWFAFGVDRSAAGIDYLVGVPELRGRGVGWRMIRAFCREVVFGLHPDWTQACAGPYAANAASWRALAKAGFSHVGVIDDADGPCNLMVLDRPGRLTERTVPANGFDFHVLEAGSGDRLALCLHGFPELGASWRHQLPVLAELGYRAWAPDLRGYGQTRPRPRRRRDYRVSLLAEDIAALIDAADASETVLIGHDWGGWYAWYVAIERLRPLDKLVVMNIPHPTRFRQGLRTFRQLRKSWYVAFFQLPWLPEKLLGHRDAEAIGKAFTDSAVHPERFDAETIDRYRRAASEPGALRAMLNWYRGASLSIGHLVRRHESPVIATPTLLLWGEQDVALGKELTEGTDEYVSDLTLRYLPDASHWVQQDEPEAVNEMLRAFLEGRPVPERADLP